MSDTPTIYHAEWHITNTGRMILQRIWLSWYSFWKTATSSFCLVYKRYYYYSNFSLWNKRWLKMAINPLHVLHNTHCTTDIPCVLFQILPSCLFLLYKIHSTICHLFTFFLLWVFSDGKNGSYIVLDWYA